MKVAADRKCFICGTENPIGLKVEFVIDEAARTSEACLTIPEYYQGWQGVVHGGIISALLDEASIYACRPLSLHAVTAGLDVRFRKPVHVDTTLRVKAEVVSIRRRFAEVNARLFCQGELMAEAEVKIMLLDEPKETSNA